MEPVATKSQSKPDLSWDGTGTPDFTRGRAALNVPDFLRFLTSLHQEPRDVDFEGLKPYNGPMQQVLLKIKPRETELPLKMCALDTAYFSDRPWRATKVKALSENVFRATLKVHDGQETEVVLKLAIGLDAREELLKEARFYLTELDELQGKIVPQYIGMFTSATPRKGYRTGLVKTCLILSYLGQSLDCYVQNLEPRMRGAIFDAILTLHDHGIKHCNLHEGNIRIDQTAGRAWIVDFESAHTHVCEHPSIEYGTPVPDVCKFSCRELHFFGLLTKVWVDYGKIIFCNAPVYLENIDQWEDLLHFVPRRVSDEDADGLAKAGFVEAQAKKEKKKAKYQEENEYFLSLGVKRLE